MGQVFHLSLRSRLRLLHQRSAADGLAFAREQAQQMNRQRAGMMALPWLGRRRQPLGRRRARRAQRLPHGTWRTCDGMWRNGRLRGRRRLVLQLGERDVPDYIEVDHTKMTAKMTRVPHLSEVPYPVMMEPHLVVEFYSR